MEHKRIKIGITPSNAPFKIACLRTFMYIRAFAEKNAFDGGTSKVFIQIDDTNPNKRKHTNEEIIGFYKLMGILPFVYSDTEFTIQTSLKTECEKQALSLKKNGLIMNNIDGTLSFNIRKYIDVYGSSVEVKDVLNGNVYFDANNLTDNGEFIIRRSDGTFLYNFSSAVDTIYWQYTDIIRGNNKINSAPFQNILIKSMGFEPPNYYHFPLLLENDNQINDYNINAKTDIRELFENGFSYLPVLNYILNTGYGDQEDYYSSLNDFCAKFDIKKIHKTNAYFDYNIMKKTCNRFYQQDVMDYMEYYDQLKRHFLLANLDEKALKYSKVGFKYKLSPPKVYELYDHMNNPQLDLIQNTEEKRKICSIIDSLLIDYDKTMANLLLNKDERKNNIKLIKYILSGHFDGLMCDVYKDCYSEEEYRKRLVYVKKKIGEEK